MCASTIRRAATEAGSTLPQLQLGLILLGLNFESASCCRMRVVRGDDQGQEAANSQGVRQNRGTSDF